MSAHTHLSAAYAKAPLILWVEDELTRAYLTEVWNDKDIGILNAGTKESVNAVVRDAREAHVFGVVDRDFGVSNADRWATPRPDLTIYRLPVFEIENYLLDADLIAGCDANYAQQAETAICQRIQTSARGMVFWLACRDVLAGFRDRIIGDFPKHPGRNTIQNLQDAEDYIRTRPWYQQLAASAASVGVDVGAALQAAETRRRAQLADGSWKREYPGKELFREARGLVYQNLPTPSAGSKSERDIAVARSVARQQDQQNRVPQDLIDLRSVLKARVS
jgi:hypothetical protein